MYWAIFFKQNATPSCINGKLQPKNWTAFLSGDNATPPKCSVARHLGSSSDLFYNCITTKVASSAWLHVQKMKPNQCNTYFDGGNCVY